MPPGAGGATGSSGSGGGGAKAPPVTKHGGGGGRAGPGRGGPPPSGPQGGVPGAGPGVAGPLAGQPPYQPFENDRLTWLRPGDESALGVVAPRLEGDLTQRRPGLFLLLAAGDAPSCCAANYERSVFRDRRVLELAAAFVTVRGDRERAPDGLLERLGARRDGPSIVLTDGDGLATARFTACAGAADVARAMEHTLRACARTARAGERAQALLDEADRALAEGRLRDAGNALRRVLRLDGAPAAAAPRAERALVALAARAEAEHAAARALEPVTARYDRLVLLRAELLGLPVVDAVRADIARLEEDEATAPLIAEHLRAAPRRR